MRYPIPMSFDGGEACDLCPWLPDAVEACWSAVRWRDLHVLVAVSGGADSVALLRAMTELKRRHGGAGRLFAGHVNHGLRGAASDADEAWLREQSQRWGVPLLVRRDDAAARAARQGDGLEAAARAGRYAALQAMAEEVGARYVAVAHTRDDQLETVLFRLLRGTGLRGLAGIPRIRRLSAATTLMRPLLEAGRQEVGAYLQAIGQSWRDDASNADCRFARNRLRRRLLPALARHGGAATLESLGAVSRQAAALSAEYERFAATLLTPSPANDLVASAGPGDGRFCVAVESLAQAGLDLASEALRLAWRRAALPEQAMARRDWLRLADLARGPATAKALPLPGGVVAELRGDMLTLAPPASENWPRKGTSDARTE